MPSAEFVPSKISILCQWNKLIHGMVTCNDAYFAIHSSDVMSVAMIAGVSSAKNAYGSVDSGAIFLTLGMPSNVPASGKPSTSTLLSACCCLGFSAPAIVQFTCWKCMNTERYED
jgi:hypothetical protein